MRTAARAIAHLQADSKVVAAVLSDVERWDDWLRGVATARLLANENAVSMVEIDAPGWSAHGLLFELAVDEGDGRFELRQIGRFGDTGLSVAVRIRGKESGAGSDVEADARLRAPLFARDRLTRRALARAVAAGLHDLDVRSQQMASGEVPPERPKKLRILEVRRAGGGLEVWWKGETFRLASVAESKDAATRR